MVKVEIDGKNAVRRTILQPLRQQGTVTVDDARLWTMVYTNERQAMSMPSPVTRAMPTDQRMELIQRNYRLSMQRSEVVAGRPTHVIFCRPRHRTMPARRIFLDQKTLLPLRTQVIHSGTTETPLDTLSMETPRALDPQLFDTAIPEGFRAMRLVLPTRVPSIRDAESQLPFAPWAPRSMPFGLTLDFVEIIGRGSTAGLALRMTDGFVTVTLYQWRADRKMTLDGLNPDQQFTARGVRMVAIGDAPTATLQRINEAFAQESQEL